ncbi:M20 family metallopeptidase [Desulfitobacterium sp. AusDCA]|uniref:M20 family metallopeptidase n=1 Tax=Desulfitobacterium sp. AusDCA TaxID=3240383 RepID=UPI003DA7523E
MSEKEIRLMEMDRYWATETPPLSTSLGDLDELLARVEKEKNLVFAEIDKMRDEAIGLLQELVRTPSVNPSETFEKDMADLVKRKMCDLGLEVRQIEPEPNRVSNCALYRGTEGYRTALFYAHMDVVPEGSPENWQYPPFGAEIADGKMYGRGAKDCKLGLASGLMALKAIQNARVALRGNMMLVAGADEETGGQLGLAKLVDQGWIKADYAIYGEGKPDELIIGARGLCQIEITVRGKTTHTAHKRLGINAIVKMADVIKAIDKMTFTNWQPHEIVPGRPVASVNIVKGGFKENVVPDKCTIVVDIRFLPGMTIKGVLDDVERELNKLRDADPYLGGLDVSVRPISIARPVFISSQEPLVKLLAKTVGGVTGKTPVAKGILPSTDSRFLIYDAGIPTVNFAMGNDSGHSPNEYIVIDEYIQNIKIYAWTALALLL